MVLGTMGMIQPPHCMGGVHRIVNIMNYVSNKQMGKSACHLYRGKRVIPGNIVF